MKIDLPQPQRPTGLRNVTPPPRPPPADSNEFASFAAQLAARSEKHRVDAASAAAPTPSIDRAEAANPSLLSLLASRRAGPIGAGVLLLATASVAALAVWGLPFQASTLWPSNHAEQAKGHGPSTGKLEAKILPPVSTPPAATPLASATPAPPRTASPPPPLSPAAAPPLPVAAPPAPKELVRSAPEFVPAAPQIASITQPGSAPLTADEIRELQGKLKAAGFNPGPIDGVVGRQTRGAVREYGQARALPNADATRELFVRLKAEPAATVSSPSVTPPPVTPAPVAQQADKPTTPDGASPLTPDEIRILQDRLKAAGFNPGAVDGVMGRQTRSAVRDYAEAQGIPTAEATRDLLLR